ncbi:hypothetical protein AMJ87_04825 [candidate division WOR_3 bacterium SM23_60]|uniref:Uncharacterized protein n=1 Tax=candidate division WOR_3 bacterium SM23_60 TaxID=1703780 RepID=A0A0S8GJ40_UNCW3|nr:MAG: hypothetical protein AMJ87_04825 [candidate division WOR_3 bacterium SM23_60]
MVLDNMEDIEKGPFCAPFGQLFYENLEKMPSFQVMEAYLLCLVEANSKIEKAIGILEGILKKGNDRLKTIEQPEEMQYVFGKTTGSRGEIEKEIEALSQHRRDIDSLIARYSENGIMNTPISSFMIAFDAEYKVKVEKKRSDSEELYYTDIKASDLIGCAGFEHLNKVMTGHLLKKLLQKEQEQT